MAFVVGRPFNRSSSHSGESRNPDNFQGIGKEKKDWTPAFAGVTKSDFSTAC
jgi:hypothetical protein